ncbi:MAG TPA: hypothetical protein VNS49_08650 [Streptomyces sp.]|nr:hypothetical protein [Streptomyces sp.]
MSDEPEPAAEREHPDAVDEELLRREELLAKVREANEQSLKWPR